MPDLAALIREGSTNLWLFVPSAVVLGALHGLEPGHSKTMMAAFIVAIRGTVGQAVLLGLSATVSHTAIVWVVALVALWVFFGLLFVRFIVEWVMVLSRSWRPRGAAIPLLELTYSATDPPLRFLRRFLPPLRLGSISLDVGFILLFIVTYALIQVVGSEL